MARFIYKEKFDAPGEVLDTVRSTATESNVDLLDVGLIHRKRSLKLTVMIASRERAVSVYDCEVFSRRLQTALALTESIRPGIELEVMSAGIFHEFKYRFEFEYFRGRRVAVRLRSPEEGRYTVTGALTDLADGVLRLQKSEPEVDDMDAEIDMDRIKGVALEPLLKL
jgi:ribosome maturation factor RimP